MAAMSMPETVILLLICLKLAASSTGHLLKPQSSVFFGTQQVELLS